MKKLISILLSFFFFLAISHNNVMAFYGHNQKNHTLKNTNFFSQTNDNNECCFDGLNEIYNSIVFFPTNLEFKKDFLKTKIIYFNDLNFYINNFNIYYKDNHPSNIVTKKIYGKNFYYNLVGIIKTNC